MHSLAESPVTHASLPTRPKAADLAVFCLFLAGLGHAHSARLPQNSPSPPPADNGNSTDGGLMETSATFSVTTTTPAPQGPPCSDQYADNARLPGLDFCGSTLDRKTCKNSDGNEGLGPYPPAQYAERCTWDMSCGRPRSTICLCHDMFVCAVVSCWSPYLQRFGGRLF